MVDERVLEIMQLGQLMTNKASNTQAQKQVQNEIRALREEIEASQTKAVTCPACDLHWSTKYDYLEEDLVCKRCNAEFKWNFEYGRAEISEDRLKHHKEMFRQEWVCISTRHRFSRMGR